MTEYFPDVLGLSKTKRKLSFFVDNYKKTQYFPSTLLCGGRGVGKTFLAEKIANNLNHTNSHVPKPFLLLNCGTLKTWDGFVSQLYIPNIADKEITIAFDECHQLPDKITTAFLTLFNQNANLYTSYTYNDLTVDFNFRKQTFIFMTSESQQVFHALQDRLEKITLESYKLKELGAIINNSIGHVIKDEKLLKEISQTVRGNPRKATQLAEKIKSYLQNTEKNTFEADDWIAISKTLDIMPLGLSRMELDILKLLLERQTCSLTSLAASLGMTRESLMKDHELYLLRKNLMEIGQGSKRQLTRQGFEYLRAVGVIGNPITS